MSGVETDVWDQLGAYQTGGAAAEFLRNTEFMEVEKPDDTTPKRVNAIVNGTEDDPTPNVGVDHPNIVAIMNESWADFEDFGNLTLTESPMITQQRVECNPWSRLHLGIRRGHKHERV